MKSTLIKPMRVQRLRKKGFNLQEASRSGLPVKYVGRPTKWGNPFKLSPDGFIQCYSTNRNILDPWIMWSATGGFTTKDIVELYGMWFNGEFNQRATYLPTPPTIEDFNKELKGHDLACFCSLDSECHVDFLLTLEKPKTSEDQLINPELEKVRQAFADYYASEGCQCCEDTKSHLKAEKKLAEILKPEKYQDGIGYNWYKYKSE